MFKKGKKKKNRFKIRNFRKIRLVIPSLILRLDRRKYYLPFGIWYDVLQNRATEQYKVARITLCLLLSILKMCFPDELMSWKCPSTLY